MRNFFLGAILISGLAAVPVPMGAQDHGNPKQYYDKEHKDKHVWNDNEASAWNKYRDEHHVKQADFDHVSHKQQQDYWNWRHDHPDAH
jgi:hypothetical protein